MPGRVPVAASTPSNAPAAFVPGAATSVMTKPPERCSDPDPPVANTRTAVSRTVRTSHRPHPPAASLEKPLRRQSRDQQQQPHPDRPEHPCGDHRSSSFFRRSSSCLRSLRTAAGDNGSSATSWVMSNSPEPFKSLSRRRPRANRPRVAKRSFGRRPRRERRPHFPGMSRHVDQVAGSPPGPERSPMKPADRSRCPQLRPRYGRAWPRRFPASSSRFISRFQYRSNLLRGVGRRSIVARPPRKCRRCWHWARGSHPRMEGDASRPDSCRTAASTFR